MRAFKLMPLVLIFLPMIVFAQDERLSREAEFEKLTNTEDYFVNSPFITADSIIFFYKGRANMILVAGDFNDWKPELLMRETETNFWQYSWGLRLAKGTYKYKLVVDDIWINDPGNTNIINDDSGQAVSYFDLKEDFIPGATYPLWLEKDIYQFKFESASARSVSLVGDFNNWNPYLTVLSNTGAADFFVKVRLKPGIHSYCFVVDDEWKADPNNLNQYSDRTGTIINIIYVPDREKRSSH
jgi:1,4-alpha-glucan branching enzyme